jgi:F-type H+-transporting ATPase subunit c
MKRRGIGLALLFVLLLCLGSLAFAAEGEPAGGIQVRDKVAMTIIAVSGLTIAIASTGGAIAQSKALSSALEGIARNPGAGDKIMVPMIIGLAMIESLVIYALVISLMLVLKL